jgi:SPP1 family predicted phage head-tail adaptor
MNISDCRYVIQVQKKVPVRDSFGSEKITYQDYMNLRASVKFNGGAKGIDSNEVFTSSSIQFETHYREITEDMRIVFIGKKYRINSIVPVGYRTSLIINCELIND